ncbi:stage II sporulation protein P [Clostridium aminobutyricum]|uniref:Stage II sporulation protein P n=1 Tax=Clostridium aminobutyricum TaxID=33953 RepID=A0A939D712_CLOAM|nr:stage II sporulation protein P [Clostridium aminobutyricum]MBN7772251.1 stage II sporulation protein P [Clostridium aminobutyricum]
MKRKQLLIMGLVVFLLTSIVTVKELGKDQKETFKFTEESIAKLCLSNALIVADREDSEPEGIDGYQGPSEGQGEAENLEQPIVEETPPTTAPAIVDTEDAKNVKIDSSKPLVIIYHTHATEAYQPYPEGNFHHVPEEGTVREVGNVLTAELQKLGVQVIHDKTIHDNPSYNQSYSRSLETIQGLLAKYNKPALVIDLHRDAASYSGNVGKTAIVNGETVAKYDLVIGQGNANVQQLTSLANAINQKAEGMYPGYGGKIIEKEYRFNEYVSDNCILLEIGNNENNIRDVKASAKCFANVIAEVIKDRQ